MEKYSNKKRRGDNIKTVLMILAGSAFLTLELLDEVFGSYHRSYKSMHKSLYGGYDYQDKSRENNDYDDIELQRFYALLNKLKNQGLIKKKQSKNGSLWNITKRGFEKLGLINKNKKPEYDSIKDNKVKVITFDIPERERRKRAWLREALTAQGFSMLHQSVWVGKNKIPEQFLVDLRDMELLNYIHILEVSASGTIRKLS